MKDATQSNSSTPTREITDRERVIAALTIVATGELHNLTNEELTEFVPSVTNAARSLTGNPAEVAQLGLSALLILSTCIRAELDSRRGAFATERGMLN